MDLKTAKSIVKQAIIDWNVKKLVRITGTRAGQSIEIKEKQANTTWEQTALDNFIAAVELQGLTYKGIGVGFDANNKEYTMIFSINQP